MVRKCLETHEGITLSQESNDFCIQNVPQETAGSIFPYTYWQAASRDCSSRGCNASVMFAILVWLKVEFEDTTTLPAIYNHTEN